MPSLSLKRTGTAFVLAVCLSTTASAQSTRIVDIPVTDGVVLKGTLFAVKNPGPAVLLLHQCDEQRKVWDGLGNSLAKAGITALSVDNRGYGESGGTPYTKLTPQAAAAVTADKWPADFDAALAFLLKQPGVQAARLGLGGGSCGVNNATMLARRHGGVKALLMLAGGLERPTRLWLRDRQFPIFAAAAADDKYADFVMHMSWLYGASKNPASRFAQYPTGGHAAVMFSSHAGLTDTIATWFAATLTDQPQKLPRTNGVPMNPGFLKTLDEIDQPGGAMAVGKRLADARKSNAKAQLFPEYLCNQLGYEHMLVKDFAGGVDIMKLEVAAYPESPNAMDSLGDVYLASGNKPMALETARKTLVLLEKDRVDTEKRKADLRGSAEGKIKQLAP